MFYNKKTNSVDGKKGPCKLDGLIATKLTAETFGGRPPYPEAGWWLLLAEDVMASDDSD